ncbi:MAG: hypothetical protein AAGG08_05965 [Actinomycetota bacterium]
MRITVATQATLVERPAGPGGRKRVPIERSFNARPAVVLTQIGYASWPIQWPRAPYSVCSDRHESECPDPTGRLTLISALIERTTPHRSMLVYLDTQQWNYLTRPRHDGPGIDADLLFRCVQRGHIRIVGSLDLVQELVSASFGSEDEYKSMVSLHHRLAGPRVLHPISRRHGYEARHGGVLPVRRRYLRNFERENIAAASMSLEDAQSMADEIDAHKDDFLRQELELRDQARAAIEGAGEKVSGATLREWFAGLEVESWVGDTVAEGVARGDYSLPADTAITCYRFPSSWLFTTIRLARLTYTLGEGRKIQSSDLADAHHVASGAYFDIFVTDDRQLALTIDLLPWAPFLTMTSAEFTEELRRSL